MIKISLFKKPSSILKPSIFLSLFLVLMSKTAIAEVVVNIKMTQPAHHLAEVTVSIPAASTDTVDFRFPMWRTGRYTIMNLSDVVRAFDAKDENGQPLKWQKVDKATWRILGVNNKKVSVNYQIYANQLGSRTRHVDDSHAFIDASAYVMYTDNTRGGKHIVNIEAPKDWRSVSGMENGENEHQFIADNFDVLIDSPIETGIHDLFKFEVDGRQYELLIWGKGNYDVEEILSDFKVMVKQAGKIWDDYPFERYVFMVHATSGARGATEHLNSTIIQRSRYTFSKREEYLSFLTTASHEFVHTWNVKAYRPAGLVPYDYEKENYSTMIWLSEGSTSYLQYQLLTRGDLMTAKEFMDILAKRINNFENKPGTKVQTVAEASFDTWMSTPNAFSNNSSVGIYTEGFMVSWLLDYKMLSESKLKHSYRDVHNELYKHYKIPHGFTEEDVQSAIKAVTGEDYSNWWQENVHQVLKPDFNEMLNKAGLRIDRGDKTKSWSGLTAKSTNNGAIVTLVESDSPAWKAGLTTDDIIIAVEGLRLNEKDIDNRIKNFKAGETIEITYFRRDVLQTTKITLGEKPEKKLSVKTVKKPSKKQKAFFEAWVGMPFPEESKK